MAKNYDLFLERMKQKYNVPQTTYKPQTALQKQNTLSKTKDTFYNPSKAAEPQKQNGFDDLNLWNKFGAMYHQARTSFETSFLDLGEGVIDAILTGVGSFADWIGADGLSDTMTDWTKAEWLSALPEQDWFNDYFGLDFLFSEQAQEVGRRDEALPEIVDNVASGIGSAVGYGLLNMVPVVGPALAWMGGGGAAAEQALNEGASNTEAMLYGGAVGGVEFATEKFLGKGLEKVGLGLGKFAGWGKGTSTTAKQVGKSSLSKIASNFGKNFFEEGMEEVVSEIVDPLLKKGTYKRDESLKELWGEQVTAENLIQTFLIGGLTGGVMEGANIAGGIVSSGGIKNWDIRQEAQQLQIINSQMEQAILEGDEQKLKQLQAQKEQAIKSVETKFDNFVNDLKNKPKAKGLESTLQYATQRDMSQEDITLQAAEKVLNGVKNKKIVDDNGKKTEVKKINVEYSGNDANGKQVASHYNPNNNTVYLNKENLKTITSALETISHEVGHAIHTSGLNTNFINQMITNFNDFDSLIDNQANKGKVNSIEDVISYYENEKGYGKVLEDSNLLKQRMQENNISKEQAYQELRDNYMLEEIANDIFSKKYFSNLLELQAVISGAKPNKIRKIKEAYRKLYANTNNKPENYKEVMKIFTDGINQNYERFYENLEKNQKAQEEQTTDKKYKLAKNKKVEVDNKGNVIPQKMVERTKNSKVRDENGNLVRAYHTAPASAAGFTVFDANQGNEHYRYKGKYVNFFTNDYKMSASYGRTVDDIPSTPVDFNPYKNNQQEFKEIDEKIDEYYDSLLEEIKQEFNNKDAYLDKKLDKKAIKDKIKKLNKLMSFIDDETKIEFVDDAQYVALDINGHNDTIGFSPTTGEALYEFDKNYDSHYGFEIKPSPLFESNYFDETTIDTPFAVTNIFNISYSLENYKDYISAIKFIHSFRYRALSLYNHNIVGGIYSTYLNIENPLIIEGNGSWWNEIKFDELNQKKTKLKENNAQSIKKIDNSVNYFYNLDNNNYNYDEVVENVIKEINNLKGFKIKKSGNNFSINEMISFSILSKKEFDNINLILENYKKYINQGYNKKDSFYKSVIKFGDILSDNFDYLNDGIEEFIKVYEIDKTIENDYIDIDGNYTYIALTENYITMLEDILEVNKSTLLELPQQLYRINDLIKETSTTNDIVKWAIKQGDKYDGVIFKNIKDYGSIDEEEVSPNDVYVTIKSPNQIKDIRNENPTDDYDIRYKLSDALNTVKSLEDYSDTRSFRKKGYSLTWYDERLQKLIEQSSSKTNDNYYNKATMYISPQEFLALTLKEEHYETIEKEVKNYSKEEKNKVIQAISKEPIWLDIDMNSGKVVGHEGRHRMYILMENNFTNVQIEIRPKNKDENKFEKPRKLIGQYDENIKVNTLNMLPLNEKNIQNIKRLTYMNRRELDVRYKLSDDIKTPSDVQKAIETLATYEDQLQENKITQQQYDSRSKIYTRDINNTIKKAYEYLENKYEQGLTQSEIDEAKAFNDLKNGWLPPEAKEYDFSKFANAKLVEGEQPQEENKEVVNEPIQEKETPKLERNKDVDEKVTYDFSELKTKDDFLKVALDISKHLNQVFNGTTEKRVSDTQSLYTLKNTIESETATNEQKQKAYDLYKERYDLAVYYSKRFDELIKVAKNVFPPISKNKDSKEFTKFQKEFNEARMNNGYMAVSSTYKTLSKPSDLTFAQIADEEVLKAQKAELETVKENRKNYLKKIVKEYQLIDEEQKGKYERLLNEIKSLTIDNYKEQKSVIKEKLYDFEEQLKPNKAKLLNVNNKKESYTKKIDRKLKAYPNEVEKVKNSLNELNKMIDELTIQNYADEATLSKIDKAYEQFEKLIESNENQSKQFDKDNAGHISAFDYHYKGLLNDFKVGEELGKLEQKGKYKEAYEKGLEKLNSINNTIENSENLKDPSSMGLKDLISHLKNEAQNQEKELRPYIYDRIINDLETKLQEIETKLAKLDEYVQKLEGLKTKKEQQDQKEKELKEAEELKKKQEQEKKAQEEKQKAEEEAKAKVEQESKEKKETQSKPKTKKQPKEVIKFIRQTVYLHTESAKSVKSEADQTQLKKYTKQTCEDLIDMVGDMMSTIGRKKRIKTRVYFSEGGKKKAIDDLFKAFNTLASDPKALTEKVIEILKTGMEFQMPDYTIGAGKIKKQSRKVYMTDENLWLQEDKKYVGMVELVNQELIKIVQDTIEGKGNPTLLAREISKRTQELEDRIAELEDQIDILVDQINNSKETVEVKIENATNNEELTKVNNELNKTNRKINQLEKELQKFTSKKEKVISDLKTKNAELKTDLLKQTKQVEKITKENIELKTDLEGQYKFTKNESNFLKRLMKDHFKLVGDMDLDTVKKVSEKYNKGDIDGVVDVLIDFLKGSKVQQEALEFNEETQKLETITEKVPFTDVYSDDLISRYIEAFKQDIVDRINNKRTTKQSALPKALQEIEKLRTQIKTNKETAKRLTILKGLMKRINNLARNKRPSALFNNIDKRFEAIAEQLGRYSQTTMLNGNFREILKEFKKFLTEDRFDGQTFQEMTGLEFPQELFEQLDQLENVQGQITLDELDLYNKILSAIEVYISKGTGSKKITIDEKEYILEEYVAEAIKEQQEILNKIGIDAEHFGKLLQTVDPRVVFKILSGFNENSKLYKLFEELQKGDTNSMSMQMELQEKLVEFNKKHKKFKKKVLGKKVEINGINATNGQFISIYKSLQREHAKKHILNSGIDLNGKVIRFTEQQLNDLEIAIENQLELKKDGSLMKEYFELTKDFFEKAGKVKAQIDELLYGYADIEQGEYFPIQISSLEFNRTLGEKKYVSKMAASFNYSWQKAVIGDLGAIKIGNVQDIIDLHSRQVADYYGFGLPLDLFNQIYSFKVYDKNSNRFVNLKRLINDRFGTNKKTGKYLAEDYIKILFDDIRGVNTYTGEVDGLFKRIFGSLRKKYSTYILGANLKTAGVQLAAIPAARKYLSLKSMRKALGKIDWDKYPLPKLGEYRTYDKTILKSETINDQISYIADKFGIIMTLTDQFTIKYAWKAALYETNFDIDKATKLFEKIVRETQPQYSAIERSALMRSSNDLVKLLTQFQSQNNKNFSTIMEMIYKAKYYKKLGIKLSKEDVQQFRRSIESIVFQGVFATAIAYLFKFLLHDLDDEDLDPLTIIGEFFNNNVLGLIPLMNNIKLDLTGEGKLGYIDIYETNLGMIDKLYDAVVSLGQWTNPDKTMESKIYNSMNTIGVVTGIPTENLYKYSMAILKWVPFTKDMAFSWDANIKGISMTNKSEINEALKNGKINVAKQYYQTYTSNILELDDYTTNVLFNLYKKGFTNAYIKQIPKTLVIDNEQVQIDRDKFIKTYSKLTPQLNKLVKSTAFNSLTDEEKEKTLSKLINVYYSLAKKEQIENAEYSDLELIFKYCNNFKSTNLSYLVHISNIEETKTKTRKEMVQRYIQTLPLSAGEKYLLYVLSGYSISDKNRNILRSFLSASGMPTKQINILLG